MTHYGPSLNHANREKTLIVVSIMAIIAVAVVSYVLFGGTIISSTSTIPNGTPYITEAQAASLIGGGGTYNLTVYTPSSGLARFLSNSGNSFSNVSSHVTTVWLVNYSLGSQSVQVTNGTFHSKFLLGSVIQFDNSTYAASIYNSLLSNFNGNFTEQNMDQNGMLYSYKDTTFLGESFLLLIGTKGNEVGIIATVVFTNETNLNTVVSTLASDLNSYLFYP